LSGKLIFYPGSSAIRITLTFKVRCLHSGLVGRGRSPLPRGSTAWCGRAAIWAPPCDSFCVHHRRWRGV